MTKFSLQVQCGPQAYGGNVLHDLACFHETELKAINDGLARDLGGYKLHSHAIKPTRDIRGGILLFWNSSFIEVQDIKLRCFFLTAKVILLNSGSSFLLSAIYRPMRHI